MCPSVSFNQLPTRLNFSARTTDRHCKCTDDVVTQICKICMGMLQMSLFFCFFLNYSLLSVVLFWNDIPYQPTFSVNCTVVLFSMGGHPKHGIHATVKYPADVSVFMFYHLIDVNWECSQSKSWLLPGDVTIPKNVHQSD